MKRLLFAPIQYKHLIFSVTNNTMFSKYRPRNVWTVIFIVTMQLSVGCQGSVVDKS